MLKHFQKGTKESVFKMSCTQKLVIKMVKTPCIQITKNKNKNIIIKFKKKVLNVFQLFICCKNFIKRKGEKL